MSTIPTRTMELAKQELKQGKAGNEKNVHEALGSLETISDGYREWLKTHSKERRDWQLAFEVWAEMTMRGVEEQVAQPPEEEAGADSQEYNKERKGQGEKEEEHATRVGNEPKENVSEAEEVISDVMLQHKQALLDEWQAADEVWELQANVWAGACVICRIRGGHRMEHDWRDCTSYPEDRGLVHTAHGDVEIGLSLAEGVEEVEGSCVLCWQPITDCWMQVKREATRQQCEYYGVIPEVVAGVLAIGPEMVGEWEDREGRRRGAGVEGVSDSAGQRFGAVIVGRV